MAEHKGNGKKPIREIKRGAVKAAVWKNDGAEGAFYKVTIERLYKADGKWKSTGSFSEKDLADVVTVAVVAREIIGLRKGEAESEEPAQAV